MAMTLDFNDRERTRYGKMLRDLAENATKAAEAIETHDDAEATIRFMVVSMAGSSLSKELGSALVDSLKTSKEDDVLSAHSIDT